VGDDPEELDAMKEEFMVLREESFVRGISAALRRAAERRLIPTG